MPQGSSRRLDQGRERRFCDRGEKPLDATIQNVPYHAVKTSLNNWDARWGKIIPESKQVTSISKAPCGRIAHIQQVQIKILKESKAVRTCPREKRVRYSTALNIDSDNEPFAPAESSQDVTEEIRSARHNINCAAVNNVLGPTKSMD